MASHIERRKFLATLLGAAAWPLREFVPGLRRLAILANVDGPAVLLDMREVQTTARPLGLGMPQILLK
jgi:hypothetical protein